MKIVDFGQARNFNAAKFSHPLFHPGRIFQGGRSRCPGDGEKHTAKSAEILSLSQIFHDISGGVLFALLDRVNANEFAVAIWPKRDSNQIGPSTSDPVT